ASSSYVFVDGEPVGSFDTLGLLKWTTLVLKGEIPIGTRRILANVYEVETDDGKYKVRVWKSKEGAKYWCHGLTFGGLTDGGPYSAYPDDIEHVLEGDGWKTICCSQAKPNEDIAVFRSGGLPRHSGFVSTPPTEILKISYFDA